MSGEPEPTNLVLPAQANAQGETVSRATLSDPDDQREKIVLHKPYIIPIVFIPGVMGTNLRDGKTGNKAWRPPNMDSAGAIMGALATLLQYTFKNTKNRSQELQTGQVAVDYSGPIGRGESGLAKRVLVARGWGSIMRSAYHPFMGRLQNHLNNLARYNFNTCQPDRQGWAASSEAQEAPKDWGADENTQATALTQEEILHAANYQFDVWAAGYNWLQSNADSGKAVKELIEETILPYYNEGKKVVVKGVPDGKGGQQCSIQRNAPSKPRAEKVIIVTHSMGGLVSRALTEIAQCDKVLGVCHGVQPATGAAATYKRMRAGFEGAAQLILGRNAADVVGILAQAPGPLELLPTADYNGGQPWLKLQNEQGEEVMALPNQGFFQSLAGTSNPYDEIYLSTAWYGLVPEANTPLLDPLGKSTKAMEDTNKQQPRELFEKTIQDVMQFHQNIQDRYKDPTYVFYGAEGKRDKTKHRGGLLGSGLMAASNRFTWQELIWKAQNFPSAFEAMNLQIGKDDGNGCIRFVAGGQAQILAPKDPGDGTVPQCSGEAPVGQSGVQLVFAHGQGCPGKHNNKFCYEHQDSYNDDRALYASLYSIIKLAQGANWHQQGGGETA